MRSRKCYSFTVAVCYALSLVLVLLLAAATGAVKQTYDIYPEAVCRESRDDIACLTISNITNEKDKYFASNTVLVFHDGEHVLLGSILAVSNISNLTLAGYSGNNFPAATFTCINSSLSFLDVHNLEIVSIGFNSCNVSVTRTMVRFQNGEFVNGEAAHGAALAAYSSTVHFDGENSFTHNVADMYGGAICIISSNLTFSGNTTFADNYAQNGGALAAVDFNDVSFTGVTSFRSNTASSNGGAVFGNDTNTLTFNGNSFFIDNLANFGGAVHVERSNTFSVTGATSFRNNIASSNGGAIFGNDTNTLSFNGNSFFIDNLAQRYGGAVHVERSNTLTFTGTTSTDNNTFVSNTAILGGGVYAEDGNTLVFNGNASFMDNNATSNGGAVFVRNSNILNFTGNCTFIANTAVYRSGAVYAWNHNFLNFIGTSRFIGNVADPPNYGGSRGGAVYAHVTNCLNFIGGSSFVNNSASSGGAVNLQASNNVSFDGNATFMSNNGDLGGAIFLGGNDVLNVSGTCTFMSNVGRLGGAVYSYYPSTILNFIGDVVFANNSAYDGGAIYLRSTFNFLGKVSFVENKAANYGGGVSTLGDNPKNFAGTAVFSGNTADYGGAVEVRGCNWMFNGNTNFVNNTARYSGGGLYAQPDSCINFAGNTVIEANTATLGLGGGGYIQDSIIYCTGNLLFTGNQAPNAGGLFIKDSSMETPDIVYFTENIALIPDGYGGAIFAFGMIRLRGSFEFYNNTAGFGGGLAFSGINGDFILVRYWIKPSSMSFVENHANRRGGAIYVEDNPFTFCSDNQMTHTFRNGMCFLQVIIEYLLWSFSGYRPPITLQFFNNTAVEAGDIVYGGLLNSCIISAEDEYIYLGSDLVKTINKSNVDTLTQVSSDPFKLCLCDDNKYPNCHHLETNVMKYPGEVLTTSVVAVGQMNGTVPSVIRAISENLTNPSDFRVIQPAENNKQCSQLQYPLHSTMSDATLKLYSDEPCSTSGLPLTITITFLPCPVGFTLSEDGTCICDKRLKRYTQNCSIQTLTFTRRGHDVFWMGAKESEGLILHPHCPFDYCRDNTTTFTLNSSNLQCQTGRSAILCGACVSGYSLALGSSQCLPGCSNTYLVLLPAFALAGLVLVVFLFLCRLTIAEGALGGLSFYANVLAINHNVFFPSGDQNFLTVFIAWLNLDLGIETCFFVSLDAYYKTWLQFVFPIYIWLIVGAIIFLADRSTLFARLIGSTNPVAILATLFLLSYTKLLRAIMAAFSFTTLEYPNGKMKYVWLYDGNLDYLDANDPRHVSLFLFSLLFFLLVFLPYTFLLLCGQWIQTKLWWLSTTKQLYVKSFLDAYYAPYKLAHRYWVGLLLLLRFLVLFVTTIISINNPQDPFSNLLVVLLVALTVSCWISRGVYRRWYLDLLEASFSFNLVVLVGGTYQVRLSGGDQAAVVYTSTSITFVVFLGIVLCAIGGRVKEKFPEHCRIATCLFSHKKGDQGEIGNSVEIVAAAPAISNVGYSSLEIVNPQETAGQLELRPGNRRGDENN